MEVGTLWEARRAFSRLNTNSRCATMLRKRKQEKNKENKAGGRDQINTPSSFQPFAAWHLLSQKRILLKPHLQKFTYFCTQEAGDYSRNCEVNEAKMRQASPSFLHKWKNPHCTQHQRQQILKKKRLNSILHRISSIWACLGCCYHTQLPWYLRRFIKMATKDAQEMSSPVDRGLFHLALTNMPLWGQNAAPYNSTYTTMSYLWQQGKTLKLNVTPGRQDGCSQTGVGPPHRDETGLKYWENIFK